MFTPLRRQKKRTPITKMILIFPNLWYTQTMAHWIALGGVFMAPIVLASVLALALILDRLYVLGWIWRGLARRSGPPALKAFRQRIAQCPKDAECMGLEASRIVHTLEARMRGIEVIGRIAPLLGLLGTVAGLVKAFMTISAHKGGIDPSLLAGGIWQALLTTIAGLVVAIPCIVAHEWFQSRIDTVAFLLEQEATLALRGLTDPVPQNEVAPQGNQRPMQNRNTATSHAPVHSAA